MIVRLYDTHNSKRLVQLPHRVLCERSLEVLFYTSGREEEPAPN